MLGYSNVYWISIEGLQKERDKIDQENIELQKENERFHQEIKFEKIHNADLKNELKKARRNNRASEEFGTWDHCQFIYHDSPGCAFSIMILV